MNDNNWQSKCKQLTRTFSVAVLLQSMFKDTFFCSLIFLGSRHRAKRSSGESQRQNAETRSVSVSSRPRWRKEADIQDRKPPDILFDSTPLYRPAKKGSETGIKSIEISINKTRRQLARSSDNSASSEEDMLEDKEGTHASLQGRPTEPTVLKKVIYLSRSTSPSPNPNLVLNSKESQWENPHSDLPFTHKIT